MFAALDKENLMHGHQTAAASKPLNQTVKYLPPKTPSNRLPKTPFKIPLNDENGPPRFGKLGLEANGRGNENLTTVGGKGGFLQKNAFITPLGIYLFLRNKLRKSDLEQVHGVEPHLDKKLRMQRQKCFRHQLLPMKPRKKRQGTRQR